MCNLGFVGTLSGMGGPKKCIGKCDCSRSLVPTHVTALGREDRQCGHSATLTEACLTDPRPKAIAIQEAR